MNDMPNNDHTHTPSEIDPKLTAYALGELAPQSDDYKTIAAQVADDAALREQVEQIQQLASQLTQSYDQAASPGLNDAALTSLAAASSQHENDSDAAREANTAPLARIRPKPSLTRRLLPYAGVAACTALATAGIFMATNRGAQPTPVAIDDEPVIDNVPPDSNTGDTSSQPIELKEPATVKQRFEQRITLQNNNILLEEAVNHLSEQTNSNIIINWPALELAGIDRDSLLSINLKNVPAHQVLRLALDQVSADAFDDDKAGLRISEDFVQVSTLRDLKNDTETRVYDINNLLTQQTILTKLKGDLFRSLVHAEYESDIFPDASTEGLFGNTDRFAAMDDKQRTPGMLAPSPETPAQSHDIPAPVLRIPNFESAPGFDLNDALSGTNSGGGGHGGGQGGLFGDDSDSEEESGPTIDGKPLTIEQVEVLYDQEERIEELTYLLIQTIGTPDEWLDEESAITTIDSQLVIKTTPENHADIQQMLNKLASAGTNIDIEDVEVLTQDVIADVEKAIIQIEHRRAIREFERERRERFAELTDNPFKLAEHEPLSTFSVDVDTASYAYGRRALLADQTMPTPDAVRIEEWINYFDYGYTAPVVDPKQLPNGRLTTTALEKLEAADEAFVPFATDVEVVACPWTPGNQLVRIGIQAMDVAQDDRPPAHLVFLLDVSGSMNQADKLGLVQQGMPMLLDQLNDTDKVSIVVYAGASGLVLEAAEAADKNKIKEAIAQLTAGGSTAGGAGIKLAYDIAEKHFITGGINRVILCTDGDFNVGTSDTDELVELVKAQANPAPDMANEGDKEAENKGVYLSVMGFGTGNLNDEMMEKITNAGNGNYHYIDSVNEAVKTMSNQAGGTLVTVAKDVKLQIEFNPAKVASYRLIGYENRVLKNEDFNNDTVDAGDIGAGHSVTALYEIVPIQEADDQAPDQDPVIDELRYQKPRGLAAAAELPELLTLKLRYKPVDAKAEQGTSRKVVKHVPAQAVEFDKASEATRFASSVAAMGMILRGSPHKGTATTQWVIDTAQQAKTHDPNAYREEFVRMATQAGIIQTQRDDAFRKDLVD